MQCYVYFKGDIQFFLFGIEYRIIGQVIDGVGVCIDVVSIVICFLFVFVDIIGYICLLGRIMGFFQIMGQFVYCVVGYIFYFFVEMNGIGIDNFVFVVFIVQYYYVIIIVVFVKFKGFEIYLCIIVDFLVDFKFCNIIFVKYQIFGVIDVVWKCLIGYIYCVIFCFGDCRNLFGKCFIFFFFSLGEVCVICQERVFFIFIYRFFLCEFVIVGFFLMGFVVFYFQIDGIVLCIVVYNYFIFLSILFLGGIDIGFGVFEYRDDIRQNERLCEQVFGSVE